MTDKNQWLEINDEFMEFFHTVLEFNSYIVPYRPQFDAKTDILMNLWKWSISVMKIATLPSSKVSRYILDDENVNKMHLFSKRFGVCVSIINDVHFRLHLVFMLIVLWNQYVGMRKWEFLVEYARGFGLTFQLTGTNDY